MMIRSFFSMLIAASILLTVTGCWDRRELNELAISVGMGIDKLDGEYLVTVQVVQPGEVAAKKGGNVGSTSVTMFQAKGLTIFEAIRKMTAVSSRKIYAAHLRVVVLGEELAREGIGDALDLLYRDYELRTDFYLLVAKESTAAKVLDIMTPLETIPANKLFGSIQTSEKVWAPVTGVTLDTFISDIDSKGKNPVLSGIRVTGDEEKGTTKGNLEKIQPAAQLENSGLAVFRKDKLIGWLNTLESKGYNYIINNVKSTVGHIACPDGGRVAVEVIRSEAVMKSSVKNGLPKLSVNLHAEENIGEVQCQLDITKVEVIQELEQQASKTLVKIIKDTIRAAQNKYKTDFLGFGNVVHRSSPGAWKDLQSDWDEVFADTDVDVSATVNINRTGTVNNSFMKEAEE